MSLQRWMGMATVVAALVAPSVAAAADVRSGVQTDAAEDASVSTPDVGGTASKLLDVSRVGVGYDAAAGSLAVQFSGRDLDGWGKSSLRLRAAVSTPGADGTCGSAGATTVLELESFELMRGSAGATTSISLTDIAGSRKAVGTYEDSDTALAGPRLTFSGPDLVGLDLRCLTGVDATRSTSTSQVGSTDAVDAFCLGACPVTTVTPTPVPAPVSEAGPPAIDGPVVPVAAPVAPVAAVQQSVSPVPAPKLTLSGARAAAAKALGARFGQAFARRAAGSYHLRCALSGAKATCSVSWRARGTRFAGTLAVGERHVSGAAGSVAVTRLAVHRS